MYLLSDLVERVNRVKLRSDKRRVDAVHNESKPGRASADVH
jgi:hypothetical protein